MSSITERQVTRLQVYQSQEERHEHQALIVFARECVVDAGTHLGRLHALFGQRLEEAGDLCHKQRGRHSLTADVAQTEIELVLVQHIAVEVATDFTGRRHQGIHVQSLPIGERAGNHRHLDVAGNLQLTLYALLLSFDSSQSSGGTLA